MRKVWPLPGGVHPPENKSQSLQHPIAICSLADLFILPLNQHLGAPSKARVKVGEKVKKFQLIADADGVFSAALHAPTSGEIIAIEDRVIAHPSGLSAPCIVLKADAEDIAFQLTATPDPLALSRAEVINKIHAAGIVGLGGAGFPAAVKLNPKASNPIETLILNGTECEPYITADDALMQNYAEEVILGARLLAHAVGSPKNLLIGLEDNKPAAIAALKSAAIGTAVEIVSFPTKYPSGGEKQLIYILTGQEVTAGTFPASLGIVVQNVGTAVAAWRAVRYGEPLIERITTVVGQALGTQRNMRVRIGTPISQVLSENHFNAELNPRLIIGGPMMGFGLKHIDAPVTKTTNCILAASYNELPEPAPQQACIRCGYCAEVCPAGLLPQQLYWYAKSDDHGKLHNYNLFDCIECGACSYVCPSAIPLVQYYRSAKGAIRIAQEEKKKSDRARERFEYRQARIAKEEAEKEAKRAIRRAAADRNKEQLASLSDRPATLSDSLISTATNEIKNLGNTEQDKARWQRSLESLTDREKRLQQQILAAGANTPMAEKLTSQLKQCQLRIHDTNAKLINPDIAPTDPLGHSDVKEI
jgi:electron transport complex protein RnfC